MGLWETCWAHLTVFHYKKREGFVLFFCSFCSWICASTTCFILTLMLTRFFSLWLGRKEWGQAVVKRGYFLAGLVNWTSLQKRLRHGITTVVGCTFDLDVYETTVKENMTCMFSWHVMLLCQTQHSAFLRILFPLQTLIKKEHCLWGICTVFKMK